MDELNTWISRQVDAACTDPQVDIDNMERSMDSVYTLKNADWICICAMVKSRYIGDGHPTFNRNPYNGYITPTIGLMTIPYYMEIMGV